MLIAAVHESGTVQVFGRRLSERGDGLAIPASENLHNSSLGKHTGF